MEVEHRYPILKRGDGTWGLYSADPFTGQIAHLRSYATYDEARIARRAFKPRRLMTDAARGQGLVPKATGVLTGAKTHQ